MFMEFENINEERKKLIAKWEALGFLDGLSGHLKDNVAELYQCCKTNKINEKTKVL